MQVSAVLPPYIPLSSYPGYFYETNNFIQNGQFENANQILQNQLKKEPNDLLALTMLAINIRYAGKLSESSERLKKVLEIHPGYYPALVEVARQANLNGDLKTAHEMFLTAHRQLPASTEILQEWASVLERLGDKRSAIQILEHGLSIEPNNVNIRFDCGRILQVTHENEAALTMYAPLLNMQTPIHNLYNNFGIALLELKRYEESKHYLELAAQQDPNNHLVWANLASWYRANQDIPKAIEMNERALKLAPAYPITYNNLALSLSELQQWQKADDVLCKAIELDPEYTGAKWNLAMSRLRMGDYKTGWPLHEYRWEGSSELRDKHHNLPKPLWKGESLKDKTLFVWGEQGMGDALQFSRYVPLIIERVKSEGGRVEYCCFKDLKSLFSNSFQSLLDSPIIADDHRPLPEFDLHCPLMMLPMLFDTTLDTIPQQVPYLTPTTERVEHWQKRLASDKKLRVGLVWTGSLTHQRNPYRAVGIEAYTRFKDIPNASFYSLQFNAGEDIKKASELGLTITDWTSEMSDFNDSAAFMKNLDLVITVCTSTSHLAGAIGAKTWIPLDVNPHWVWLLEREDSPWYPHSKLYRQTEFLNWEPVLQRLHSDLSELAKTKK